MRRLLSISAAFVASSALLVACSDEGEPAQQPAAPNGAQAPTGDAAPTSAPAETPTSVDTSAMEQAASGGAEALNEMRDTFVNAAEDQLAELETMIGELRTQAEASETAQALRGVIDEAEESLAAIRSDLDELRNAATSEIESLSANIGEKIQELYAKVQEAGVPSIGG